MSHLGKNIKIEDIHIFISHDIKDQVVLVDKIDYVIRNTLGIKTWYSKTNLKDSLENEIYEALASATYIFAIITPNVLEKAIKEPLPTQLNVVKEINHAHNAYRYHKKGKLYIFLYQVSYEDFKRGFPLLAGEGHPDGSKYFARAKSDIESLVDSILIVGKEIAQKHTLKAKYLKNITRIITLFLILGLGLLCYFYMLDSNKVNTKTVMNVPLDSCINPPVCSLKDSITIIPQEFQNGNLNIIEKNKRYSVERNPLINSETVMSKPLIGVNPDIDSPKNFINDTKGKTINVSPNNQIKVCDTCKGKEYPVPCYNIRCKMGYIDGKKCNTCDGAGIIIHN